MRWEPLTGLSIKVILSFSSWSLVKFGIFNERRKGYRCASDTHRFGNFVPGNVLHKLRLVGPFWSRACLFSLYF